MKVRKKWAYKQISEVRGSCAKNISSKYLRGDAEGFYLLWNANFFVSPTWEFFRLGSSNLPQNNSGGR